MQNVCSPHDLVSLVKGHLYCGSETGQRKEKEPPPPNKLQGRVSLSSNRGADAHRGNYAFTRFKNKNSTLRLWQVKLGDMRQIHG